ncbi:ROK family transcriptional regulator [Pseudarthrobacter sp. NamE5]|uniref:ROK family transcriptional regulator n=1 Tax=Pseudarthrobacter sp. NamE5 TaxID=2576839 RepID=UPI00110A588E|nr:ROK family transcriptional regulator [Pseudarthrobacter sp. NamE5]TLM88265.1 ROK family transcriptional regulator [Pseudarthrobacter sp. NamE5]
MVTVQELPRHGVLASITEGQFLSALASAPEPLSRAEIAEQTRISKPAISEAAKRLTEHGIISTTGTRRGGRGGVATLFEINGRRAHSVALALAPSKISVRAVGMDNKPVFDAEHEVNLDIARSDVIAIAKDLLAKASEAADSPLEAICVSVANPVDPRTGDTVSLENSAFAAGRFNAVQELGIRAPSIVVDNDVNWATLAERHLGAMAGEDNFVYIYMGDGLGAGLFLGGALQRGHRGLAGEIGYLRDLDGLDLTQGLAAHGFGRGASYGLDSRAVTGPPASRPSADLELAMQRVAHHVANIVTLLNPRAVVLGGPLTKQKAVPKLIEAQVARLVISPVEVTTGSFAPLDGAGFEAHRLARRAFGF